MLTIGKVIGRGIGAVLGGVLWSRFTAHSRRDAITVTITAWYLLRECRTQRMGAVE